MKDSRRQRRKPACWKKQWNTNLFHRAYSTYGSLIPENKGNCEPKYSYEVPKVSFKDRFAVFKFEFHYSCKFIRSLVLFLKDINFSRKKKLTELCLGKILLIYCLFNFYATFFITISEVLSNKYLLHSSVLVSHSPHKSWSSSPCLYSSQLWF